jgi:hypothetical protein
VLASYTAPSVPTKKSWSVLVSILRLLGIKDKSYILIVIRVGWASTAMLMPISQDYGGTRINKTRPVSKVAQDT